MAPQDRLMRNLLPVEEDNHSGTPLLDPNDRKELTFANVNILKCHVQAHAKQVPIRVHEKSTLQDPEYG